MRPGLEELEKRERAGDVHRLARGLAVIVQEIDVVVHLLFQQVAQAVFVDHMIDESALLRGRSAQDRLVNHLFDGVARNVPVGGDSIDDLVVERVGQPVELSLEFVAGSGAGVGLVGAFVFADLHIIGLDAELVEKAFVEHRFHPYAGDHDLSPFEQADVGSARGEGVADGVKRVGIDEGGFAGVADAAQRIADLLGLGQIQSMFAKGDENAFDVFVVARRVKAIDQRANGECGFIAKERKGGRRFGDRMRKIEVGDFREPGLLLVQLLHPLNEIGGRGIVAVRDCRCTGQRRLRGGWCRGWLRRRLTQAKPREHQYCRRDEALHTSAPIAQAVGLARVVESQAVEYRPQDRPVQCKSLQLRYAARNAGGDMRLFGFGGILAAGGGSSVEFWPQKQ